MHGETLKPLSLSDFTETFSKDFKNILKFQENPSNG